MLAILPAQQHHCTVSGSCRTQLHPIAKYDMNNRTKLCPPAQPCSLAASRANVTTRAQGFVHRLACLIRQSGSVIAKRGERSAREKYLLPLQMYAGSDHVPRTKCRSVVVSVSVGVEPLPVIPVVPVAVWLPPGTAMQAMINPRLQSMLIPTVFSLPKIAVLNTSKASVPTMTCMHAGSRISCDHVGFSCCMHDRRRHKHGLPRLFAHLEVLVSEANAYETSLSSVTDQHLIVVDPAPAGHWSVALDRPHVVVVSALAPVLYSELVLMDLHSRKRGYAQQQRATDMDIDDGIALDTREARNVCCPSYQHNS